MKRGASDKLVRVPVLMDVKTYVQLAGKAKREGVSVVQRNSDFVVESVKSDGRMAGPRGKP